MNVCFICSKNEINLTDVEAIESDSVSLILSKLRSFLPELVSIFNVYDLKLWSYFGILFFIENSLPICEFHKKYNGHKSAPEYA